MTLYTMSLYRIFRRRLLWLTAAAFFCWLAFFCWHDVGDEYTYVNGTVYTGLAAVRMDREITEPYEGRLTDRAVAGIAAQYGFPSEVKERIGWLDASYLTRFVTVYLSDGRLQDWDDYTVATQTIPLIRSWMAQHLESDGTLAFGYARGYQRLIDFVQLGAYFASVFLMIALAPLFCEDRQKNTRELIFTTERGKRQDVWARVLAALTVALLTCAALILPLALFCGIVYGYGGGGMRTGAVLYHMSYFYMAEYPIAVFTALYLMTVCGALLMLAAMSVLISSIVKSTFHSVLCAVILWVAPVALFLSFRSRRIYFFSSMLPFTLVNYTGIIETCRLYGLHVLVMLAVIVGGTAYGGMRWRRMDRE